MSCEESMGLAQRLNLGKGSNVLWSYPFDNFLGIQAALLSLNMLNIDDNLGPRLWMAQERQALVSARTLRGIRP